MWSKFLILLSLHFFVRKGFTVKKNAQKSAKIYFFRLQLINIFIYFWKPCVTVTIRDLFNANCWYQAHLFDMVISWIILLHLDVTVIRTFASPLRRGAGLLSGKNNSVNVIDHSLIVIRFGLTQSDTVTVYWNNILAW